jgi:hypothetical protein
VPPNEQSAERPAIPCQCRYDGRTFELGERVCLEGPQGPRIARCDMAQNNTSWTFTDEGCVISWRTWPERTAFDIRHAGAVRARRDCRLGH